jgi:hypothetical protein
MASIAPKIQKLLSDQRIELQRQEAIYQAKLTDAKRKCATDNATFESELVQRVASVREECKQRIDKMDKMDANNRFENEGHCRQSNIDWVRSLGGCRSNNTHQIENERTLGKSRVLSLKDARVVMLLANVSSQNRKPPE